LGESSWSFLELVPENSYLYIKIQEYQDLCCLHPVLLARALPAIIPQEITLEEFQAKSGIGGRTTAKDVLNYMINHGIGTPTFRSRYIFTKADRMRLSLLALQKGCDIENISRSIGWKDFEALTSEILVLNGYSTETNVYFSKPRRVQIDVIGANNNLAIVADCKHWKRYSLSSISSYAKQQIRRTKILCSARKRIRYNISHAIPIILTLYSIDVKLIDGVPIVPISKFKSFIEDVSLYLSDIRVVSTKSSRRQKLEYLRS